MNVKYVRSRRARSDLDKNVRTVTLYDEAGLKNCFQPTRPR